MLSTSIELMEAHRIPSFPTRGLPRNTNDLDYLTRISRSKSPNNYNHLLRETSLIKINERRRHLKLALTRPFLSFHLSYKTFYLQKRSSRSAFCLLFREAMPYLCAGLSQSALLTAFFNWSPFPLRVPCRINLFAAASKHSLPLAHLGRTHTLNDSQYVSTIRLWRGMYSFRTCILNFCLSILTLRPFERPSI